MRRSRLWYLVLVLGTLLLVLLIVTDWLTVLRGPAPETPEWYWPYQLRPYALWLKPILAGLVLFGVSGWWLRLKGNGRGVKFGLFVLLGASFLLQLALMNADSPHIRDELINRVYSNLASGYFQTAVELDDLGTALQIYPELMPHFPSEHAQTHPPGLVVANRLTMHLLARLPALADWLAPPAIAARCIDLWLLDRSTAVAATLTVWAIIPLLMAAFTVFPAFWVARMMVEKTAVKLAVLLIAILPALLLFAPKVVQLYAPLTLLILGTFFLGLKKWSWPWFLLSGTLLSFASFLSLGNSALGLLLVVFAALYLWQGRKSVGLPVASDSPQPTTGYGPAITDYQSLIISAFAFGVGAASFWLVYWLGWGVPPWQIAQVGLGQHYELVTQLRRYDWWLLWNVVDVIVFAGWIIVVGFTAVTIQSVKKIRTDQRQPLQMLALSLVVLLILLNISGSARGEVGRIWLFLMPLMAVVAAPFLVSVASTWRKQWVLIGLQILLTTGVALAWQPVRAVAVVGQRPLPSQQATPQTERNVEFDQNIHLNGVTVEVENAALQLTLYWQNEGVILRPYTVFNQLLDERGQVVAQKDSWPLAGQWPPTCWSVGELIVDSYVIELPSELPDGRYTLITGWYDARDGRRLLTTESDDFVPVGELLIEDDSMDWIDSK